MLLWPRAISERLTDEQIEAVLAHELCHLRRGDNLAALFHLGVQTVFWFHPLVWWIGARLITERERACDEEVIRRGSERETYAESILKTCQFFVESPLACVSGVTGSDLKKRIEEIMTNESVTTDQLVEERHCSPPQASSRSSPPLPSAHSTRRRRRATCRRPASCRPSKRFRCDRTSRRAAEAAAAGRCSRDGMSRRT